MFWTVSHIFLIELATSSVYVDGKPKPPASVCGQQSDMLLLAFKRQVGIAYSNQCSREDGFVKSKES
jgi:hypothetical protein